jgi:hypothetical protein
LSIGLSYSNHNISETGSVSVIMCKGGKIPGPLSPLKGRSLSHAIGNFPSLLSMTKAEPVSETPWFEETQDGGYLLICGLFNDAFSSYTT